MIQFLGPQAVPFTKRTQYAHRSNESISVADRVFAGKVKAADRAVVGDPKELIGRYSEMIEDHLERRIAIFFQQLVTVHGTKLKFEIGDTEHQGESAKALMTTTSQKVAVRNAAHSSTIPSLVANGCVYLKGSDTYRRANSTLEMPRDINEADIAIDGKKNEKGLRDLALELINASSQGTLDPVKGMERLIDLIHSRSKNAVAAAKPGVKRALEEFVRVTEELKEELPGNSVLADRLLGLQVKEGSVREKLYQMRFQAIQKSQSAQSEMVTKVERVAGEVLQKIAPRRTPAYFTEAFHHLVRLKLPEEDRNRFDKLMNNPGREFRATIQRQATFEKTRTLVEKELTKITSLANELHVQFRNLKRDEILERSAVTRKLRAMKGWTQKDLSKKIAALFPHTASSQSTVSRVENGIKLVNRVYAQELAAVFKEDPVLFVPAFYFD